MKGEVRPHGDLTDDPGKIAMARDLRGGVKTHDAGEQGTDEPSELASHALTQGRRMDVQDTGSKDNGHP